MGRSLLHIQRTTNHQIQTTSYNMSVSFKVTLSKEEEQETRRFQVDKEVAGSLVHLKQKIAAIFPELRRSEPVLSWIDEDGDEVVVTSDEELQVKLGDKAEDGGNSGMPRTQSQLRRSLRLRRFLRPRRPSAEGHANQQLPLRPTTKLTRPPLMQPGFLASLPT